MRPVPYLGGLIEGAMAEASKAASARKIHLSCCSVFPSHLWVIHVFLGCTTSPHY